MSNLPPLKIQLYLSVCAAALSAPALAQQAIPLPGIVVQGATLERPPAARPTAATSDASDAPTAPQPAATASTSGAAADQRAAGIPASEVGTSVTVVTAKDIQQQQARTTADVLRGQPGVVVTNTGSVGGVTEVRIRGANPIDTRVLIDGIEMNTTKDGAFDFSNLSPEDIERIEIIRGPMSALYGSGASGGVINIETKAARGPLSLSLRAEGGSFGTRDLSGRLAAGGDGGFFSLTAQQRNVTGFVVAPGGIIKEGTNLQTLGLHAGVTLAPAVKLDTTLRYTDKHAGLTGFGDDFPDPSKPFSIANDSNSQFIQRTYLAGLRLSWDQFNGALTQELKGNYGNDVSGNHFIPLFGFLAGTDNNSRDESGRANFGYSATYRLPNSETFGRHVVTGQLQQQTETFRTYSDGFYFDPFLGDNVLHQRRQLSGAGEWHGVFGNALSLTAGGRRDVNDNFQNYNTWRTSASYDWKMWALRPHASLGTGVKLPGMYAQYGSNSAQFEANPNLKAETSRGYDLGVEKKFLDGRVLADITYFSSSLQNQFGTFFDPANNFAARPINVDGTSTRRGVEFAGQYQVTPALFLGAAYTYTDARLPDGSAKVRVVPHGYRFDVRTLFDDGKGTFSVAAINNSRTPDVAFSASTFAPPTTVDLASYWKVQAATSYKLQPNLEVYARVENALNAKYQDVYGYNTAGFGAYAGVKLKFDDLLGTDKK